MGRSSGWSRARVPLLVEDVRACPALPTHPARYATGSFVSAPILVENDAVGVLNAADRRDGGAFCEDDLQSAELVARSISAALHGDLLVRRALADCEVDPATGLYNRRHLDRRLAQEIPRARRDGTPLALLLVAVEGYATVAANAGVQTAGVLMRCVGEMVGSAVHQSDLVVLHDKDQMAVLLPCASPDKARQAARTVMREVLHEKLPAHLRYDCERLDLRIGVASLEPSTDGAGLARRAKGALRLVRAHGVGVAGAIGATRAAAVGTPAHVRTVARHRVRQVPVGMRRDVVALAREAGMPYLADPGAAADAAAARLLPAEVARSLACFPVACEGGALTLAMANPFDDAAIHAVSHLTGMAVYPVAAPRPMVLQAIAATIAADNEGYDGGRRPAAP